MESSRQLVQWCIYTILAFQIVAVTADSRSTGQRQYYMNLSICRSTSCPTGSGCRALQTCTRCAPQPMCVSMDKYFYLSDDDDECKMIGCDDAVLLGSAFEPRALRCVPWAKDLDNGGCSMDDTCISSKRPSSSGEPAGICCRGKPKKKTVSYQVVAAQQQQQKQKAVVVAKQKQAQYVARKRQVLVARKQQQAQLVARKRAQIVARKQAIARQQKVKMVVARQRAQAQYAKQQQVARQQVEMAKKLQYIQASMDRKDARDMSSVSVSPRIDYPDDTKVIHVVDSSIDDGKLKLSDDSNTYHVVETVTYEKIGYCPMDSDIFFNNCDYAGRECFDDNGCPDDLKCCRSGCGVQYCTIPLPDNIGYY